MIPLNSKDEAPYRLDLVLAIWTRIERTADALRAISAIASSGEQLRVELEEAVGHGATVVDIDALNKVLLVLSQQDGMHAADWLRARAVEAQMPRRKTPASVDLQIRLKGVQCKRLVAQLVTHYIEGTDEVYEAHRVTIKNVRGDVASVESPSFSNALEGAIAMAGARRDDE